MTLQWWQEDQSPDDFYTVKGDLQALSFFHRPDGTDGRAMETLTGGAFDG